MKFTKGVSITREANPYLNTQGEVILPEVIENLPDSCFYECSASLIQLPTTLRSIEGWCFEHSESLIEINIPEGVTSIGETCFAQCSSLSRVTIPSTLKRISRFCFWGCLSSEDKCNLN